MALPFTLMWALDDLIYANLSYNWLYINFLSYAERLSNFGYGLLFFSAVAAPFVAGALELAGVPVVVVDLATRFGVPSSSQLASRQLVVLEGARGPLALCADQVLDPEEVPADHIFDAEHGRSRGAVKSVLRAAAGLLPLLEAELLLGSRSSLDLCRGLFAAVEGVPG